MPTRVPITVHVLARRTADLGPLVRFLPPAVLDRLVVRVVDSAALPPVAKRLLDHRQDMTSTLEAWIAEALTLRVLARERIGDALTRQVVLVGAQSGRAAEFGAIIIHLDRFTAAAQADIVRGEHPLGTLLARHAIAYRSYPRAFLEVHADSDLAKSLGPVASSGDVLWGRTNILETLDGAVLARVVEILPSALTESPECFGPARIIPEHPDAAGAIRAIRSRDSECGQIEVSTSAAPS